ncbi:MAG: hypothetical protein CL845_04330 [Crocinitomicaceae bacterium]|nr:hypothetical protein [Crocinitomicaceae bacterium]
MYTCLFSKFDSHLLFSPRTAYLSSMQWLRTLLASTCLLAAHAAGAQLVISEVSAHNGVTDIQGDASDWIELRNDGAQGVELGGFTLNDGFGTGGAVPLPNITLEASERLLILASGEDRAYLPENWRCPAVEGDQWQYVVPSPPFADDWRLPGFDASSWFTGAGGFGYGDNDDVTIVPNADCIFLRKEFEIASTEDYGYLSLGIDYDDGFIAFLNGLEIARSSNMAGVAGVAGDFSTSYLEAVLYSGGQPEQWIWNADEFEPWLVDGTNVFSVQVHNFNAESSDLSIRPFLGLTRKDGALENWSQAPAWWPEFEGYIHVHFQLSTGESVVLRNADGDVVDALPIHPDLEAGYSVGRLEGETEDWCIFDAPTPGEANQGTVCYTGITSTPSLTIPSGWYNGELAVGIAGATAGYTARYTTNGDLPIASSPVFPDGGLIFDATTCLSVRVWDDGNEELPSDVQDEVYIIDEFNPDIPTFSILVNEDDLWDWNNGIYVMGPNASDEYPHFGANFWQPWSRLARMQLFDADGILQVRENMDLEIHGGWSRAEPQRSFRLDFKSMYTGNLDWPLFPDKPESITFNNINLRNGGQHSWATKMQDALVNRIAMQTHIVAGAWQPAHLYLNGAYWGLYGAREKYDEHSIAFEYGTDKNEVDLIGPGGALAGEDTPFFTHANQIQSTSTTSQSFFPLFSALIDVENYIDYFVLQTYIQNTDWMGIAWGLNNVKVFRASPDHKWEYLLYDTDAGLGFFGASVYENYIENARYPNSPNVHSNLFSHALDSWKFRHRFINRYADLVNTIFQPWAFNTQTTIAVNQIQASMPHHIQRWNSPASYADWLNAINNMVSHNEQRVNTARNHLMSSFNLPEDHECTLDVFPPLTGLVRINTITPGPLPWDGIYFENCPIEIEAIAQPGYIFEKWDVNAHIESGEMDEFEKLNEVALYTNDLYRARFLPCPEDASAAITSTPNGLEISTDNIPYVDSVAWFLNGTWISTEQTWWPNESGDYHAVVYFDGCTEQTEVTFSESLGVFDAGYTNHTLNLWPNPTSESFQCEPLPDHGIEVFDARGGLVANLNAVSNRVGYSSFISTKNWPEGIYIVRSGPISEKLIVQH